MLEAAIEPVGQQLEKLKLQDAAVKKAVPSAVKHVQQAFGELFATSPSVLVVPAGEVSGEDKELEARMWDVFAEVYEKELQQLQQCNQELTKERKRQILADILVWAEITQSHYDKTTASFVTEPHGGDASFQRIGKLLQAAKKERGL